MNAYVRLLAHQVLNKKHLGIPNAMIKVLGPDTKDNINLHIEVLEEIQDILISIKPKKDIKKSKRKIDSLC